MSNTETDLITLYKDNFRDLLSDVDADDPNYGNALVAGFKLALEEWRQYHLKQANEYEKLGERIRLSLPV